MNALNKSSNTNKKKFKKILLIAAYIVTFAIAFIAAYSLIKFYLDLKEEYKSSVELLTPKITEATKIEKKNLEPKSLPKNTRGFVTILFEKDAVSLDGKDIKMLDVESVNITDGVLKYASSNSTEYEYLDYTFANGTAYFVARKIYPEYGKWTLFSGSYNENILPIVYNAKKEKLSFENEVDINVSPNAKNLAVSIESGEDNIVQIYSLPSLEKALEIKGKYPVWISDTEFVYSDKIGNVRRYNLTDKSSKIFWPSKHEDYVKITLSKNKEKIALYFDKFKRLIVLELDRDKANEFAHYSVELDDFLLSPDGKEIMVMKNVSGNNLIRVYELQKDNLAVKDSALNASKAFDFYYSKRADLLEWYK